MEEETGLRATNPRPFATFDLGADDPGSGSHFFLTVFRVDDPGGDPVAQDDAREVGWFTPDEVRSLPVPESMVTCMDMLARGEDLRDGG